MKVKMNQNNGKDGILTNKLKDQVLKFLNEESYFIDDLSEEETDYFNKCVETGKILDEIFWY